MNVRALHFDWNWQLSSTPATLWPLVSDTNRLNKEIKLPPVRKSTASYDIRTGHAQLTYNSLQNTDAWEEEPFEWERPYRFGVKRRYKNGAFREIKLQVDLLPNAEGTRVRYRIWASPRNILVRFIQAVKINLLLRRRLKKTFETYDRIQQQNVWPYEIKPEARLVPGGRQRLEDCTKKLNGQSGRPVIVSALARFLTHAADIDLSRISPFQLADHWNAPRGEVLRVFLHATKVGLLDFSWDLYCPTCRSLQERHNSLNEINKTAYCSACRNKFYVNFNNRIQLSFRPNPLIRKIADKAYCVTGPQSKPHVAVQQFLSPGQKRYLKVHLLPGNYSLRALGQKGEASVRVNNSNGSDNITVVLDQSGFNGEEVTITEQPNLVFHNKTGEHQVFLLEQTNWNKYLLSAAEVTSLQLFRDLFDKEVLHRGKKIAVDNLTLMFTDLYDSTGMYDKEGDETAVGKVIEHFEILQQAITEERGGVVKTIGDSVMAVFNNPVNAFRAFMKAHQAITRNEQYGEYLKLKAGIHHGSCMAVNLNSNIDYFGSTVNIASRLVDFADEDELVFSEPVRDCLENSGMIGEDARIREQDITLRGFGNELFRISRMTLKKSPLRLVV
ncbi:DUF5939 domain-containing protein [Halalkalibaculum sp. DA3122]|uniref:adenylate/guanylate cyclase domain-containing protein n=1 Tax=unclassified Halalkalibaculum TaxID=2964617 RepID=UPI003754B029